MQVPPAVQATQDPEVLQTMLVPQDVPGALLPLSMQVCAPVVQDVVPFLHALFGLVVQALPVAQGTQAPEPLQTMLVPQLTPGPRLVPSAQVAVPEEQSVTPFLQRLGLPMQVLPAVQPTQPPLPSHTMLVPQLTPGDLLVSSTQAMVPVEQAVTPFLQVPGLLPQEIPAVQELHVPEPLQTMLVPQVAPAVFAVPFTHVWEPELQDAVPL
jgi:hypothetical protein